MIRQDGSIRSVAGTGVRRFAAGLATGLALIALTACEPVYRNHGYVPSDSELAMVEVGRDTRDGVIELVGAPTTSGVLNDAGFYYVQSRFRDYAFQETREIERQVLVISFDARGVVANIERFGLQDGQVVALSRRVTDDNLRDTTFIRQLLSNAGNFDAGGLLNPE